ncbi:segregation/condensation protein A [Alkalinema pantanalense CENA528]|uniref:segregation/condensation protein A n=1 Tax=Alkalinema pantanalense TaxID=1620705 RepID=UPI003D700632
MALSLARDAIAFLIDLAETGEIDPWDVNVIDVIDRFLNDLSPFAANNRNQYEANLSQSGQAFLYASMLLLLKADSMNPTAQPADDGLLEEGEFFDDDSLGLAALPMNLERRLRRRAVAQPPKRRRVTLQELIDQLEIIAAALEEGPRERKKVRRPKPHSRSQAIRTIAQLAHQENLTEMAVMLEEFFVEHWDTLSRGQDWIDFDLLLEFWLATRAQSSEQLHRHIVTDERTHERVGVFWALLLLTSQSKVELSQESFYQDLRVRTLLQLRDLNLEEAMAVALPD